MHLALASINVHPFYAENQRTSCNTVSRLTVHIVWASKYRYSVLEGDIKQRCRTILRQICDVEDVIILKGVVSNNHVHMHINYLPSLSVSSLVEKLKGRSSRKLQQEFPELNKKYWGRHFWAIGYGCWSTGNITDEMVNEYLEHHRKPNDEDDSNFILE